MIKNKITSILPRKFIVIFNNLFTEWDGKNPGQMN